MKKACFLLITMWLVVSVHAQNQRIVLIEEFSSSTCTYCKPFNEGIVNLFLSDTMYQGKYVMVNYRADWPGSGDPYNTQEASDRITFYSVPSVPDIRVDGKTANKGSLSQFKGSVNNALNVSPKVIISSNYEINRSTKATAKVITVVEIQASQNISGVHLFSVVCEKKTTKNASTNGEKEFHHVMMKMIPSGGKGKSVTLLADSTLTIWDSVSLSGTNIEEMSDLEVVTWVQNKSTKEVLQAVQSVRGIFSITRYPQTEKNSKAPVMFSNNQFRTVKIPNARNAVVQVFDITGKQVIKINSTGSTLAFSTEHLPVGYYTVRVDYRNGIYAREGFIRQ